MARFAQLHLLRFYGPSNLNRDDLGRPKTVRIGDRDRLRVSSQAIKRAVRVSDHFQEALANSLGRRSRRFGRELILERLLKKGIDEKTATTAVRHVIGLFTEGKGRRETTPEADRDELQSGQLIFLSDDEVEKVAYLAERKAQGDKIDKDELVDSFSEAETAADIAMFGRMMSGPSSLSVEAAVQVSHAFTTHEVVTESDVFSAVDELNTEAKDAGAGHFDSTGIGFGSGVFYLYVCIDRALLIDNLGDNRDLARDALDAFVRALATVSPSGKQASFASRARADYILGECGDEQPRSLAGAFARPVCNNGADGAGPIEASVKALDDYRERLGHAYGPCAAASAVMSVPAGEGTLDDVVALVTGELA